MKVQSIVQEVNYPVVLDNSCPPFPRSSSLACTITDRPMTEYSPDL